MEIIVRPVAFVRNQRKNATDDFWGQVISEIELARDVPVSAFENISAYSHLEIIYFFDKVKEEDIIFSGKPRGNPSYPTMGIFGQRKKDRPNRIGLCTVELLEHAGSTIRVKYLDAIDGTPVLDIKPVIKEFGPQQEIRQPAWVSEMMKNYWE